MQKKITRRLIAGLTLLLAFAPVLPSVYADGDETEEVQTAESEELYDLVTEYEEISVSADAYVVIDMDGGRIIADHNMKSIYRPASTTKILTALVVLENVDDLSEKLTFSHDAVATNLTEDSSTLTPVAAEGEKMTVRDALYGMLLSSGNECANALAEYVAGSNDAFAKMMNDKAKEIGCRDSHFTNPSGLDDDDHYTTAYDLALIMMSAMENPDFLKIDTSAKHTIQATNKCDTTRLCVMGHKMISGEYDYPGVIAGKTGCTELAGRVLVTVCEKNGSRVLVVIMHADEDAFYDDTAALLDYAYTAIPKMEEAAEIHAKEWETQEEIRSSIEAQIQAATDASNALESMENAQKTNEENGQNTLSAAEKTRIYIVSIAVGVAILILLGLELVLYMKLNRKSVPRL